MGNQKFSASQVKYFAELNQTLDELTSDQFQVLEHLQQQRRVAITGCAGSGKTLLAVEQAIRLAGEGLNVLILCHNPLLADSLRARVEGTRVYVTAFTPFVYSIIDQSERPKTLLPPRKFTSSEAWSQYDAPGPKDLDFVYEELINLDERFDAVIIDEGQDFDDDWLSVAEACLADEANGILYIFYDDHQLLAPLGPQRRYASIQAPYVLGRNCRNAGEIYEFVQPLSPHAPEVDPALAGKGIVREWIYSSEQELFTCLHEALLLAEHYSPLLKDMAVITSENLFSQRNQISGFVFDSPQLREINAPAPLDWQKAVLGYLRRFGCMDDMLSPASLPTPDDIRTINRLCINFANKNKQRLIQERSYQGEHALEWSMDRFGLLVLRWTKGEQLYLGDVDLLRFFGLPSWAASLPPTFKRYRLTPYYAMERVQDYFPVRLVDVATFKGLEADGVVFVLPETMTVFDSHFYASLYVALSRARNLLHIVSPFSLREKIKGWPPV